METNIVESSISREVRELYQELIIDHGTCPRNFSRLKEANREAEGYNPLCGDKIIVYLKIIDQIITDISFQGQGCAISMASASLMTELLKGKNLQEAKALFHEFQVT